jgi:hypothetical protein
VFTSGATEATNIALGGLLAGVKAHTVTSAIEHSCVRDTFADLEPQTFLSVPFGPGSRRVAPGAAPSPSTNYATFLRVSARPGDDP